MEVVSRSGGQDVLIALIDMSLHRSLVLRVRSLSWFVMLCVLLSFLVVVVFVCCMI